MKKQRLFKMELLGAAFVFLFGMLLRYSLYLSDGAVWSYLISSVNGSAWEQMKPFTIPFFIWCIIELAVIRPSLLKFITSKIIVFYAYLCAGLFYMVLYTAIAEGAWRLFVYAGLFVIILLSHICSYKLICSRAKTEIYIIPCLAALVIFVWMMIIFTVHPPKAALFFDTFTGTYGLDAIRMP